MNEGGVDNRYFREAVAWEDDVVRSVKRSRAVAWVVAFVSLGLAGLAMIALVLLLPLKSFEPYVVEVDKTTGFLEIKRALAEGPLTQSEAINRMYVVRYVKARESYDAAQVKDNFDLAQLLSTGEASKDLVTLYGQSNPDNPVNRYGRDTRVITQIKSVQLPNERTAVVRFATERTGMAQGAEEDWVALMHFRFTKAPASNSWRFENPLGFQILDYRRDQESLPGAADKS